MSDLRALVSEYLAALDTNRKVPVPGYGKQGGKSHEDITRARARRLWLAEQALREAVGGDQ